MKIKLKIQEVVVWITFSGKVPGRLTPQTTDHAAEMKNQRSRYGNVRRKHNRIEKECATGTGKMPQ